MRISQCEIKGSYIGHTANTDIVERARQAGSAMSCAKQAAAVQQSLDVERIRQHPGQQQVDRAVKVDVPGKHFPQLQQVCCGHNCWFE